MEVDETYIGGERKGRGSGNFKGDKSIVVGAVEVNDKTPGRIRFRVVEDGDGATLQRFIREVVESGSTVMTDGASMYKSLDGYRHEVQIVGKGYKSGEVLEHFHTAVRTSRRGCKAPSMGPSATITYRRTSTSSASATTDGITSPLPSRPSSASRRGWTARPTRGSETGPT